ncbi:hypothetical protein LshimejAT787_0111910 [Lyophyllum shimeji]|uniref:WW domain-containing protein n=1 Tax=Lyophyllum shimeji TaxID=47721 RepID=A0A9P3PF58_LYOSH|nr:hypothetical protein LshimejAT787_0111910 [Lyophyllum shimeji]
MPSPTRLRAEGDDSPMQFIETTRYQRFSPTGETSNLPVPSSWEQFEHPNGDIYYYNRGLRLITPENIRDPTMLRFVLEARDDHLRCLDDRFSSIRKLPDDWELTLSDVTDEVAVIGMYSRKLGVAYDWTEERGLVAKTSPEYFWSHVAEYPSHHTELPPNTEEAFAQALASAKIAVTGGAIFPFSETQIDQMTERYDHLKALQAQGKQVTPALGWLMGAVMPLDAVEKTCSDEQLGVMMLKMRF